MREGEPKFERDSSVSKIVGVTPEEELSALSGAKEIFEDQTGKTIFIGDKEFKVEELEREKTPEEKEVIAGILAKMPEFIEQYGGVPVKLSEMNIRILDRNKLPAESFDKLKESGDAAGHYTIQQFIYLFDTGNLLRNATHIAHEVIHFNSFQSFEKDTTKEFSLRRRRYGLASAKYPEKIEHFHEINEALTEELARRFGERYFGGIPVLTTEIDKRDEARHKFQTKHPDKQGWSENVVAVIKEDDDIDTAIVAWYSYPDERGKLNEFIDELYNKNKKDFSSREDIFDIFARASASGKLLPLARLVEKTYRKGSFRRLGEKSKSQRISKAEDKK